MMFLTKSIWEERLFSFKMNAEKNNGWEFKWIQENLDEFKRLTSKINQIEDKPKKES